MGAQLLAAVDRTAIAAILVAALAIGASVATWPLLLRRRACEGAILPFAPREAVPWHAADVLLVFGMFVLVMWAGASFLGAEDFRAQLLIQDTARVTSLALAAVWLKLTWGATRADWGLARGGMHRDLLIGAVAAVAVLPPLYILQAILIHLVGVEHPMLEKVANSDDPWVLGLSVVSAVVVAPITEEIFFRALFQGWLERVFMVIPAPVAADASQDATSVAPTAPTAAPTGGRTAIFTSAALFAVIHIGSLERPSSDPIPIFFLACVLGYLYQRTHRILPCIVLHMILNYVSMAMFLASR